MKDALDPNRLETICAGDSELEKALAGAFANTYERCLDKALEALTTGNRTEWENTLHELKGTSLNIGANVLADLCKEYEYREEQNAKQEALEKLKTAYEDVKAAFKARGCL